MRLMLIAATCLALAACGQKDGGQSERSGLVEAPAGKIMAGSRADFAPQRMAAAPAPAAPDNAAPAQGYIAYSYHFTLELPAAQIGALQAQHAKDCAAAGSAACQMIDMNLNRDDSGQSFANLRLRVSPAYLKSFVAGLDKQTADAGGKVIGTSTGSEDLTRPVTDTATQLKTKTELRDKYLDMLKRPDVKFGDIVQVEQEVARLQQEIDSATSMMTYYRSRVDFSEVSIGYQSAPKAITDDLLRPLRDAAAGFLAAAIAATAGILLWLAAILPWMVLIALVALAVRGWWKRREKV